MPLSRIELSQFHELMELVTNLGLNNNPDKWICIADNEKEFTVTSIRKLLINSDYLVNQETADIDFKWNKTVLIKANITSWRIANLRLPTRY